MQVTTIRRKPKQFAWSYSKLKNFETCPHRYEQIDLLKNIKEEESEHLAYGNAVHKALAEAIEQTAQLPEPYKHLQGWVDDVLTGGGKLLVEQKLAIDAEFSGCDWFSPSAWYRGIADVIKITGPVALVMDWKTGKILEDAAQLALMAQCVFAHHPCVKKIRAEFIWLKEDATTRADYNRNDMAMVWKDLMPRIELLKIAHELNAFPPKKSALCRKWCPVVTCKYHGE